VQVLSERCEPLVADAPVPPPAISPVIPAGDLAGDLAEFNRTGS